MNWQSREDERVARALDGAPPPYERDDRGVLALAERIRGVPAHTGLDAAPAFRDALRARLLAEGAGLLPHPRHPDRRDGDPPAAPGRRVRHSSGPPRGRAAGRGRVRRRRALAATVVAVATLSAGVVTASGSALPGDPLYGLKQRVQGVEVALARGDVDRGHQHLERARSRVRELATARQSTAPGPLVATLDDMDSDTRTGVRLLSTVAVQRTDAARLAELGAWTTEQRSLLDTAAPRLPAPARDRAVGSLALLGDVAARVSSLRGVLRCECPAAVAKDELGPRPCVGCGPDVPAPQASAPRPTQPGAGSVPTVAATRSVPSSTGGGSPTPSAGVAVPVPPAGPTGGAQPSARPPAKAPAPPPVQASDLPKPVPNPLPTPVPPAPPVVPAGVGTSLLDALRGALGLGVP